MLDWLYKKGIAIDPASNYDDVQLQQIILWWHMINPKQQDQVEAAKPVIYITVKQHRYPAGRITSAVKQQVKGNLTGPFDPKGGTRLVSTQEGNIVQMVSFNSKRFWQPAGVWETDENVKLDQKKIIDAHLSRAQGYDGGWATVLNRWDLNELVTGESAGPQNLYSLFVFAHEFTHMSQNLFEPLYEQERRSMEALATFTIMGGDPEARPTVGTPSQFEIFRSSPANVEPKEVRPNPLNRAGQVNPDVDPNQPAVFPSERSWNGVPRSGRLDFIGNRKLQLKPGDQTKTIRDGFGKLGLAVEGGLDIKLALSAIFLDIRALMTPLTSNQQVYAPTIDPEWVSRFEDLAKYLSHEPNSITVVDGIDQVSSVTLRGSTATFLDSIIQSISSDTATFNSDDRTKIRNEFVTLTQSGLEAVNAAVKSFRTKVVRSVFMQQQICELFPSLVNDFTEYSKKIMTAAMDGTKSKVGDILCNLVSSNNASQQQVIALLPKTVYELLVSYRDRYDIRDVNDLGKIKPLEWYEMGAQLGLFNIWTQEYDAEAHALWVCCPDEFVEMYKEKRGDPDAAIPPARLREILNQATYIAARGIYEHGRVPEYYD